MGIAAIVAGTGYEGRAQIIRRHVREGQKVYLEREPNNEYDPNAIAVYIEVHRFFRKKKVQIGYIKAQRAKSLAKKMDAGEQLDAIVYSYYAPPQKEHPRVSLDIEY